MKLCLISTLFITLVNGKTFWQVLREKYTEYTGGDWESIINSPDGPFQPKPDPLFPALKLFVYTRDFIANTVALIYKIDPENLNEYTTKLNEVPTVLYIYGYLDKPAKFNTEGKFELTSASVIFWAYMLRVWWAEFYLKPQGIVPPASMYANIVFIDWSAYNTDYFKSLANVPAIANVIGDKLYAMSQDPHNRLNLDNWHFVGHSLGAHMVGMIASRIKLRAGRVAVPKVTGLDPAGPIIEFPFFRDVYPRLTKECGKLLV